MPKGQKNDCSVAETGTFEPAEKYSISTPQSWSDNDSVDSMAWMSTSDLSKILPEVSNIPSIEPGDEGLNLRDVVERQDLVIERLVKWCQNLEEEAVTHRKMLVAHERTTEESEALCAKMVQELLTLKASAQSKSKAQGLQTRALYKQMQARVDNCVTDWCSKRMAGRSGCSAQSKQVAGSSQIGKTATHAKPSHARASSGSPTRRQFGSLSERLRSTTNEKVCKTSAQPQSSSASKSGAMSASFPLGSRSNGQRLERYASPNKPHPSERYSSPNISRPSNSSRVDHKNPLNRNQTCLKDPSSVNLDNQKARGSPIRKPYERERSASPRSMSAQASAPSQQRKPRKNMDGIQRKVCSPDTHQVSRSPSSGHARVVPKLSADQAHESVRSDACGRGFKFVARSVSPPNTMQQVSQMSDRTPTTPRAMVGDARNTSRGSSRGSPSRNNASIGQSIAPRHTSRSNSPATSPRASNSFLRPPGECMSVSSQTLADLGNAHVSAIVLPGALDSNMQSLYAHAVNAACFGLPHTATIDSKYQPPSRQVLMKRDGGSPSPARSCRVVSAQQASSPKCVAQQQWPRQYQGIPRA